MRKLAAVVVLGVSVSCLVSCEDSADDPGGATSCVERFAESSENDFKDYPDGTDNRDSLSTDCQEKGGLPEDQCSFTVKITRNAAVCIAKEDGLEVGINEIAAGLVFHGRFSRPVWNVKNTLYSNPDGSSGGKTIAIDAANGELLRRSNWGGTP